MKTQHYKTSTATKVAIFLRYAGFKATCNQGSFITIKGISEEAKVEITKHIANIYPNFKGEILSK